jgi:PAS domain S-box-containing protein
MAANYGRGANLTMQEFDQAQAPPEVADAVSALLSAIVDSSQDAIVSKTLDGIVTSWNRAAEEMFGYTAAEAIGRHITSLIIPPERLPEEDYILDRIRHGQNVDHFETIRMTKDGRRLNISVTISPVRDKHGRIIGASKIARDITQKKLQEKEREELLQREQESRRLLAEAVKSRDEFIAVAAHELRNPLNVFLLNLQLLHRISTNPAKFDQFRRLLEKSREQVGRISMLVDRLLDVTRIQAGTFELFREDLNLSGLIGEVVNRFAGENPSISLSAKIQTEIHGRWDRVRLDQAFTNLISNAIKYGMGRPVTVTGSTADHHAIIAVKDQGVGIPEEDLERIFDRFERAGRNGHSDGLGLGLWITKQIVRAHGGTISAESEPGKGSCFVVRLPLL